MKKDFDCVDMKRRAQERIQNSLRGMTREQELAYWAEQTRLIREAQARADPDKQPMKRSA